MVFSAIEYLFDLESDLVLYFNFVIGHVTYEFVRVRDFWSIAY